MKHRHLDYAVDTPLDQLPSATVVDLLERGDLGDWQPIVAHVARAPDGALAKRVMELVDRYPMYGTSPLIRAWIDRIRAAARLVSLVATPAPLRDLRRHTGLTQVQLAERIGMSQSDLSKLERRRDTRLSTLRGYVRGLGGRLLVLAILPGKVARVRLARRVEPRPPIVSKSAGGNHRAPPRAQTRPSNASFPIRTDGTSH